MSVIAAMAPNGRLYVSGQNEAYNGEGIVGFLDYLCRKYRRKNLIVIWQGRLADGATIHRCHEVKDFLSRKKGRVHLVALPGYSPEWSATAAESCRTVVVPAAAAVRWKGILKTWFSLAWKN